MSTPRGPIKYFLVSLPLSVGHDNDREEAFGTLSSAVSTDHGTVVPFSIPTFKIGTLDALVQQADELNKLCADCEAVVGKVGDSLAGLLENDAEKIGQQKNVNDKPVDQYLQSFAWNKVKYRIDKPIAELIDSLKKELAGLDTDVRQKFQQYNTVKNNFVAAQRKQTGNLSTRSLTTLISSSDILSSDQSDYLETHLLAVPKQSTKEYLKTYESLTPMVVPRSSVQLAADSEFTLFSVVTFQKHSSEFLHKCRERRWIPRDINREPGADESERKEVENLSAEERRLWGEALRLGRASYSEAAMTWVHALALRVFVETILRYGLPAEFVCGLIRTGPKTAKKAKGSLDARFVHLGGNAITRDRKGRVMKDEGGGQSGMVGGMEVAELAGGGGGDYSPYVFYEFEIV
ncbi:MAG: Vacuolar ATP synthase subunit C [Alyxoria varia]|nr:MAG: Vacuolar ATP synthase subunit C [Alyxoria varia]